MTTNIDRAVNIIAGAGNCDFCEMFDDPGESCAYCIRSAETFAQALADAGLLMPDLPEPSRDMVSPAGGVWYSNGPLSDIRATRDGIIAFGSWKETPFRVQLTAGQAEELAGILWAAARHHAEQEQGNE